MERERGLINVIVDEPQGPTNSIPAVWEVKNPTLALVRLHGRNHESWNIKDAPAASARFNDDYTDNELGELSTRIIEISKHVGRTHVVFNNNFEDQGQRNARSLMGMYSAMTDASAHWSDGGVRERSRRRLQKALVDPGIKYTLTSTERTCGGERGQFALRGPG
ncbi:hypothetical protein AWB69_07695 [Caballeronia udeis]|uniref:DUF72 domain-containing protein n=2 Tax=Caballeronia udeis TaxID=1232866 RepID=A0A158JEI2_9BURK|nr:hypothetical protein AWB69_07695 [Caballeronia udeis]